MSRLSALLLAGCCASLLLAAGDEITSIRRDVVTGTKYATTGNFHVWLTQNNPNEG